MFQDHLEPTGGLPDGHAESTEDDWAIPYTAVKWLQPIVEAFDDDGSGYITIAEINRFTKSKPNELDWRYAS